MELPTLQEAQQEADKILQEAKQKAAELIKATEQSAAPQIATVTALPWKRWLVYALIGLGIAAALVFAYNRFWPAPKIDTAPRVLAEAPKAVQVEKIYIPGPTKIVVYNKEDLGKKIPLAPEVSNNKSVQVGATAIVPPSPYGGTAAAYINMTTGKMGLSYAAKDRPLFGFGGKTSVGALGGVSTKGDVMIGYVGQDVLRVGPANLGVAAGGGKLGTEGVIGAVIHLHGEF